VGKCGRCLRLTTIPPPVPFSRNLGTLTSLNPLGHSRPVTGLFTFTLPACEPFDHAWFEVLEAVTLYCTWSDNRYFQGKLVLWNSRQINPKAQADADNNRPDKWNSTVCWINSNRLPYKTLRGGVAIITEKCCTWVRTWTGTFKMTWTGFMCPTIASCGLLLWA